MLQRQEVTYFTNAAQQTLGNSLMCCAQLEDAWVGTNLTVNTEDNAEQRFQSPRPSLQSPFHTHTDSPAMVHHFRWKGLCVKERWC